MFRKIQSYVTPILLSYVDKYIKDFKAEDTQVSLWSGSVSLHNLELRPDVIQQELNIPFTLSSGRIHELLIQVPWMKIVSEPIVITINTIECVLKLNDGKQSQPTGARTNKNNDDLDAPPGYVQSLANRIVSNIAFRCNNVILKYVEEDIVISVNIKQFYLDNVDGNWVPTFAEITPDDLHTRKLIRLGDLTLCLDKRNAAGKIETYLEPLLYKCEMEFRLDSTYAGVLNKRPKNTRIFINSPKLEFNFSYQQIPMILRIFALFKALKQKRLNVCENAEAAHDTRFSASKTASLLHEASTTSDGVVDNESWSGWMWSFVQPFPLGYSEEEQDMSMNASAIILFSINFESVSFSFKIPDYAPDASGIYNNQRKFRYTNICSLELKSVICETSSHGLTRFRFRGGVKHIILYPENSCPCGIPDYASPDAEKKNYFETINNNDDVDESNNWPIEYDSQSFVDAVKDSEMLAICPAFAVDYLYYLTLPGDFKDNMSIASDLEYSNLKEDLSINMVFGPSNINICSGAIHRLSLLKTAADTYDYAPYYTVKPLTKRQDLLPPSTDDYDAFTEHIPKINIKITAVKPKIHVALWDHYTSVKILGTMDAGAPSIGRRKTSSKIDHSIMLYEKLKKLPSVMFEADALKITITKPMYPNRLTYVTCQFPDPPVIMLDSCYEYRNFEASNLECFLVHTSKNEKKKSSSMLSLNTSIDQNKKANEVLTPFVTQCNFQISGKTLVLEEYWDTNDSILHNDYNYNMENVTVCGSMAKIIAAYHILSGTLPPTEILKNQTNDSNSDLIYPKDISVLLNTTLLKDAFGDNEMVHLDMNFEGLSVRSIHMQKVKTHRIVLNGVKIFAIDPSKDIGDCVNVNQVWIISAPESSNPLSSPFLKAVFQLSACELYSTFCTLKLEEWSFVMDPLFCNWLTYRYQRIPENNKSLRTAESLPGVIGNPQTSLVKRQSRRSLEEIVNRIGGSSRNLNRLSLGQSSSDREKDYVHAPMQVSSQTNVEKPKEKLTTSEEKSSDSNAVSYFNKIIQQYLKWKNIAIYLEIETVCVYFPVNPISALNYDSVNDAIQGSILNNQNHHESVLVLRLPNVIFKSSMLKQNLLCYCIHGLPAKLPADVWDYGKISYPLSVSLKNLNCYTLSKMKTVVQTNILKPLSLDITISFTSKKPAKPKASSNPVGVDAVKGKNKKDSVEKDSNNSNKSVINKTADESEVRKTVKNVNNPPTEDLSSIGVCIHIDTEFVKASINQNQMILLNGIVHGMGELTHILSLPNETSPETISINMPSSLENEKIQNVHSGVNEIVSKNLPEESLSKDSDLPESSNEMTEVVSKDAKASDGNGSSPNDSFSVSVWFQWTISRLSLKAYSQTGESDQIDKYLKLVFTAEDFVSSLDIQKVYFKWQTKVVMAAIHHYQRMNDSEPWTPGDFSGVIMKGRENSKRLKSAAENCFLFIHVTKAKSTNIHNKWQDNCKKSTQNFSAATEYLSEIEVSLQELDVILNLRSLKPFSYLVSSLLIPVECHGGVVNTNANDKYGESESCTVAKYWDSRKLPLYYFELHHPRIIIPIVEFCGSKNDDNVVIVQMDKISLSPNVDNPVCRSPLRPDLYQQAATKGYLYIPGSELEDRQFQLLIKGISVHTAQWFHLEKSFCLEMQSQPMLSENPALQWNNSALKLSNTLPIMSIVERVDVCLVIALAIFSQTEMICGPTIDFNVLNDIEMYLSTVQIQLIMKLIDEINMVFNNDVKINKLPYIAICPYQKYINRVYKDVMEYCIERNTPALSIDTGIASDMMSTVTGTSKGSIKDTLRTVPVYKITERSAQADYYDVLFTFGKISLNLFEKLDGVVDVTGSPESKAESEKEDKSNTFSTKPLLYGTLVQPNFSYSRCHYVTKFQFSIFHFSISLGDEFLHNGLPKPNDFLTAVLETKLGIPDSISDIYPNFMTVQWEKSTGKKQSMKIDVKCPIRITASLDRVEKFNKIMKLLSKESVENVDKAVDNQMHCDHFLKKFLESHHTINISMMQVVFAMIVQDDIDFEFLVSFSSYKHSIAFNSRPEKINNHGILDSLVVSLRKTDDRQSKILINPWTIGFEVNILWESWQNTDTKNLNPLVRIFLETDRLLVELSSEHITILQGILNYWNKNEEKIKNMYQFINNKDNIDNENSSSRKNQFWNQMSPNDQHYKDDLRAGAFKFIHGGLGKPLPYQVFISSRGLMWRYPQPRSITRVHSFPVPFQLIYGDELNTSNDVSVCCTLEYYSDVTDSFQYYAKFYIKQDQRVKLDQTKFDHRVVLSAIWRVVMHVKEEDIVDERMRNKQTYFNKKRFDLNDNSSNEHISENDKSIFPIKPLALAACLRIDSYFTPHLVPSIQFTAKVSLIEVNLINHPRNRPLLGLTDIQYKFNKNLQPSYVFCSLVLSSTCFQTSIWNENIALYKIDSDIRFDVIDGSDMLLDKVVELNDVSFVFCKGESDDEINTLIHSNKISMRGGPQHIHTLISSYQIWKDILSITETYPSLADKPSNCQKCIRAKPDMQYTIPRYLVCNDTNLTLEYGQVGTEEGIDLLSGACHLYSWKSSYSDQQLLLTVNLGLWKSPKGFQIEKAGLTVLKLKNDNSSHLVSIIVLVEIMSPVQRRVTFMGQLTIFNTLPTDLSLKLYHKKVLQLHGVSASPDVEINKKKKSSSLLVNIDSDSTIRLRFAEIESGWSGDIPLKECAKGNMPWLVKVPDHGNIQYISIWCRIIKDNVYGRTLVVLSPLYVIKSHLPMKMEIKLHSEKHNIIHSLGGRGSSCCVMCPGTTSTKHEITIQDLKTGEFNDADIIPLSYDMIDQTTFFPNREDNPDIDKILNEIKQWLDSSQATDGEWPYIFPEDGINWIPIAHQHNTDVVVRYLNAVKGVDSVIVDLAPWALLGNCSGVTLHLQNSDDEDICVINHKYVLIPPPIIFKEVFYSRVTVDGRSYKSGPMSVSTTALGPYERKTPGRVTLEGDSSFCIDCDNRIYIFNMAYEIIENINVFRLASKYVFINKLSCEVMVLPIALHNTLQNYTGIPANANDISLLSTSNENGNTGIPINRFNILQASSDKDITCDEESYNLFICIGLAKNGIYSCPVRIDKFIQRRSIAIKNDNTSIPVVITCQEYRGQVFITIHKDTSPQFLIQNKANMTIAIAQVLRESVTSDLYSFHSSEELVPQMVVQECWRSAWHCIIPPAHETFYTMPTQNSQYPELFQSTSTGTGNNNENLYLTFACLKDNDNVKYSWSVPVVVSTNNLEQFVKLPGYTGDIKVMVKNHCHTTLITVNNVTEDDISASDIRKRLLINVPHEDDGDEDLSDSDDVVNLSVEALLAISTNTRELSIKSYSDDIKSFITNVADRRILEGAENQHVSNDANIQPFKGYTRTKILGYCKINFICDNINVALTNCNNVDVYSKVDDLISLVCDRVVIVSSPTQKGFNVSLKIGDLQIDNPLYPRGGYDFHVVLVKQPGLAGKKVVAYHDCKSSILSQISNVTDVIEELVKDCFISCVNDIETWSGHSNLYIGWNDIHITISPISTYFEDTYISTLLDYITDSIPNSIPTVCIHAKYSDEDIDSGDFIDSLASSDVSVPEFIIWEAFTVANPIRLNRLLIEPLNILLSVHSSMLFYLALDHSPLQFAKFERINVLTSSFRLGRAVTMHYLSEAIFGAGWVVGSLEILGSPGGLARKVTAGLRDLVREPCLGLMRGPWGFLVGMTHGSASLLKHLTQGTVESMSMVMGSVARNLDRLSLDEEHIRRTERARRHRPQGLLPALSRGFQGLGLSLLGAIGGIAHEALIAGYEQRKGPTAVAAGLTRGLVGVITKPLSATADLLALTGQGLLHQAGWDKHPFPRWIRPQREAVTLRNENFRLKLGDVFSDSSLLYICQGVDKDTGKDVSLVISNRWLVVLDTNSDEVFAIFGLESWKVIKCNYKNGMLILGLNKPNTAKSANYPSGSKLDTEVQMDPALRARISAYVGVVEETQSEVVTFRLVFPNQYANHCATMVNFARLHSLNQGFPVF